MSAISLNHFLHQPWIQATLELIVTHLEGKDETPISKWSHPSNKLSFICCQLSNVQVNKNYEDAMHMTIVRWHIFFSHFSVLPIKPWMSLSLFGETHPLFTFPRPINQTLGVCASKHLQLLTHHCILPQCASKEVEGRHSCTFSGGELLGVCWWWLGWGWKRPSQPPVY